MGCPEDGLQGGKLPSPWQIKPLGTHSCTELLTPLFNVLLTVPAVPLGGSLYPAAGSPGSVRLPLPRWTRPGLLHTGRKPGAVAIIQKSAKFGSCTERHEGVHGDPAYMACDHLVLIAAAGLAAEVTAAGRSVDMSTGQ